MRRLAMAALLLPLAAAAAYLLAAMLATLMPAAGRPATDAANAPRVTAYVSTNGVHTDLVLPLAASSFDWRALFPPSDFVAPPPDAEFVAIGWGDREFYLHTPTWADLRAERVWGALTGRNGSLLHVSYLRRAEVVGHARVLSLDDAGLAALVEHVRASVRGHAARASAVPGAHYGTADAFYEAEGRYGPFDTCNTWVGRGLRRAGVVAGRWTPFDFNVLWHLQPPAARP
ncbi:MAG: TIGR02117 family protein [Comamonadaceae bacterium]|nr:MAG: TIGR02117 family protein [Comamonadaceae bacterium]